ncbi:transposon Tf2-9 polyprotein [Trichonephila clavipes]|uniref:Transposon Tf2-9 polyprotein n=1 Tax=Trichonephila clavipes TaxID=2585209 RepID=A0A8X6RBH7_TRICX|nr:transposon Tf2-9 polyprotein [Trichonephila clavipes]
MEEIYEDEDINPYFDDIALGSSTVEEHCKLLRRTLLKARKANLKFNVLKTQLSQTSVNYLGHVLSDEGIKPDTKKNRAIEEFATPNCKEDLQRFI